VSSTITADADQHPVDAAKSSFAAMAEDVYGSSLDVRGEYVNDAGEATVVLKGSN
jgi:hypothetical protein